MSKYPMGKMVPPPAGGGSGGPPTGWGGNQGGWAPPQNAYGANSGWRAPTGAWASPPTEGTIKQPFQPADKEDGGEYSEAIEYFKSMNEEDQLGEDARKHFDVVAGEDGMIDSQELQDILNNVFLSEFTFEGFGADMTRSLLAMRDFDLSGKLGFDGLRGLWTDLAWCKKAFSMLDTQKDGAFSKSEFSNALTTMGLTVTPRTHKAMMMRYSDRDGNIKFDDFVLCYMRLKTMMTTYQNKDPEGTGVTEFERDEFVQLAIYS